MPVLPAPGEKYTIRRKVLKLFGAGFHIYDAAGQVIGYCKQKAFRIREDIRIYTDDSCTKELLKISTQSIWDISGTYMITDAQGHVLGGMKRQGLASIFVRDSWDVLNAKGHPIATLREDSGFWGLMRRYVELVSLFVPEKYVMARTDGREVARYRTHFNWFVYRLGVAVTAAADVAGTDDDIDELFIVAAGCVIAAIEGRQQGG